MQKRYMAGIDGLRAISVIAVILYHVNVSIAPGGFIGVGIFFVISGYLITDQLLSSWESKQRIMVFDFWIRRIRRLIPALLVVLFSISLWLWLQDPARLLNLSGDFISALLYVNNWWLIWHEVSYFEQFGPPSPFAHLWSLSIEEQFYLIWPLLLSFLLTFFRKRSIVLILILGACMSAFAMSHLYEPGTDPSRVYYGTDTRSFALLVGAMLAFIWQSQRLSPQLAKWKQWSLDVLGVVTLCIIVWMIFSIHEYAAFWYEGGLFFLSILTAILIAVLAHPATFLSKLIGSYPLVWIGLRSYSLYLWHYPLLVLLFSLPQQSLSLINLLLYLIIILNLSHITWKYIEEPFRRGIFGKVIQNIKYKTKHIIPVSFLFCGVSLFIVSLWLYSEPKTKADGVVNPNYIASVDAKAAAIQERRLMDNEEVERFDQRQVFELNEDQESFAQQDGEVAVRQEEDDLNEKKVTAIGDSVLLGATREVEKVIAGIYIDSEVSRQMKQALSVIEKLRNENRLGDIVVISLGTNGPFTEQQLEEVLNALDDVEYIFFVNVRVPRNWQDVVNETLEKVKEGYENVFIIDWYRQSKDHPEYFVQDGVHLTKTGASHYAALIADAIHSKMEKAERKRSILPE